MRIESLDEAIDRLIDWQENEYGIPTYPASGDTIKTDAGWAFLNVNGYLGTATEDGDVIFEPELERDE